jgi:hypothetical protein
MKYMGDGFVQLICVVVGKKGKNWLEVEKMKMAKMLVSLFV